MPSRKLTREQISRFVNGDPEAIRAIESLFRSVADEQPQEIIAIRSDLDGVLSDPGAAAGQIALDLCAMIEERLDNLAYAQVIKTSDQAAAVIDTAYPITWANLVEGRGVSIGSPASRIVAERPGMYALNWVVQFAGAAGDARTWIRVNNSDVANSAALEVLGAADARAVSRSDVVRLGRGDYVECVFAVSDVALIVDAGAATGFAPAIPAASLTVWQVAS
jgi:hypothetical protein